PPPIPRCVHDVAVIARPCAGKAVRVGEYDAERAHGGAFGPDTGPAASPDQCVVRARLDLPGLNAVPARRGADAIERIKAGVARDAEQTRADDRAAPRIRELRDPLSHDCLRR